MMSLAKFVIVSCVLAIVQNVDCSHEQFFIQKSTSENDDRLLLVRWDESDDEINAVCDIISGRDQIEEALKSANYPDVETISEDEMEEYLQECDNANNIQYGPKKTTKTTSETTTPGYDGIPVIFPDQIEEALKSANYPDVETISEDEMEEYLQECDNANNIQYGPKKTTKTTSETTTPGYDGIPVIFPGTKWCGAGDRAKHYDDLGIHQDTDRCCRAHDLCNDTLAPGESRNDLKNTSPFTKLSCECDRDFYDCLDRVNSVTSNTIGNMYFNVLRRECYEKDYPDSKKCKKYTLFRIKCLEYEKDTKAPKVYKWVKAKKYKKIPFPGPLTVTLPDIIPF